MDGKEKSYSMESLKRISQMAVQSPSESLIRTMGHYRPSLVWLFDHIRCGESATLSKEDLQRLLGTPVNSTELDEAFANLDIDGDGAISLEDFLAGFARFLMEAPDTPGYDKTRAFSFLPQFLSPRHSLMHEEHYESNEQPPSVNGVGEPSQDFQQSLRLLSTNRPSIESLWKSLAGSNPELLGDFEDFVAGIADEVEGAQRALEKQRQATKQEAIELGEEIDSRLLDANTRLQIQTALIRQQSKAHVEERLVGKEKELLAVRQKLEELESEVREGQKVHLKLEQQVVELSKEKEELADRLEKSEKQLRERQSEPTTASGDVSSEKAGRATASGGASGKRVEHGSSTEGAGEEAIREEEGELLRLKKEYEDEITELRAKLQSYQFESEDEELIEIAGSSTDAIANGSENGRKRRLSGCSLMDEIVKTEGAASPILRGEPLLAPMSRSAQLSPLMAMRRTNSLPELASTGLLSVSPQLPPVTTIYVPVYVRDTQPTASDPPPHLLPIIDATPPLVQLQENVLLTREQSSVGGHQTDLLEPAVRRPRAMTSPDIGETARGPFSAIPRAQREEKEMQPISEEEDRFATLCQPLEFIESLATPPDYVFKILVVGNSYVGKSSFLMRLCTNAFSARYSSTIGVDFYSKALQVDDHIVSLQLWDTAGQERFQSVTKAYYRGAQGVILMYDISQEESFIAVKSWINSIQENVEQMPPGMLLVGNKQDLDEQNEREVSVETGETFAKIYGADFMESSAKTGYNVGNALLTLVRSIKRHYEEGGPQRKSSGVALSKQQTGSRCCGR